MTENIFVAIDLFCWFFSQMQVTYNIGEVMSADNVDSIKNKYLET